jgi:acyl dehydratase
MAIDPNKARGAQLPDGQSSYTKDQVILYHLGLGAGVPATDPKELEYTYEKNLKVLPSFAVIPAFGSMGGIANVPGMQFNLAMLLHGEQEVIIHRPLPVEAKLKTSAHIPEIYDKGKAALVILESTAKNEADGEPLFTNRFSLFIRGEGGFGGDSGPKAGNVAPDRAPDGVVERKTLPQQALIYRLSGDKNPLHADPDFAKLGGFDKPIIHGLCSYGIACKAIVDDVLGGDVTQVARYQARFATPGYPGETYRIKYWKNGAKQILLEAESVERNVKMITNAVVELR